MYYLYYHSNVTPFLKSFEKQCLSQTIKPPQTVRNNKHQYLTMMTGQCNPWPLHWSYCFRAEGCFCTVNLLWLAHLAPPHGGVSHSDVTHTIKENQQTAARKTHITLHRNTHVSGLAAQTNAKGLIYSLFIPGASRFTHIRQVKHFPPHITTF